MNTQHQQPSAPNEVTPEILHKLLSALTQGVTLSNNAQRRRTEINAIVKQLQAQLQAQMARNAPRGRPRKYKTYDQKLQAQRERTAAKRAAERTAPPAA